MKTKKIFTIVVLGLLVWLVGFAEAALIGTAWTYQGRLMDGEKPADGLYDLSFSLWSDPCDVNEVYKIGENLNIAELDVIDGYFTVVLDFGSDVFDGNAHWLEMTVAQGDGSDPCTLRPRQELTPVPYALQTRGIFVDTAGNVGIGTSNPKSLLDVIGEGTRTIRAQNTAVTGSATALYGISNSTRGCGVRAVAGAGSGSTYGVDAYVASPDGFGVYSFNEAESGNAYAIYGENGSPSGIALLAHASNNSEHSANIGVYGRSDGDYGAAGVYGEATNTGGNNYGVKGHTNNPTGYAGYFTGGRNYFEGDVGIGTTSPTQKLDVAGNVTASRYYDRNNTGYYVDPADKSVCNDMRAHVFHDQGDTSYYLDPASTGISASFAGTIVANGNVESHGPNGNCNARFSYPDGYPNHGYVAVKDDLGITQAGMYVDSLGDGHIYADIKSFRAANPRQPGTEIWYTCLEGPEAAAYVRGTGHLTNGKAEVALPEHFVAIASPQGITVQVTPLSAESKGLAVVEKAPDRFVVQELSNGDGSYDFDYMVMAVRKGHEDYQVIRSALESEPDEGGEPGI